MYVISKTRRKIQFPSRLYTASFQNAVYSMCGRFMSLVRRLKMPPIVVRAVVGVESLLCGGWL